MFFEGYSAEQLLVGLVGAVIAIVQAAAPGVSILEWVKGKLGLQDQVMHFVAIAFFMALAALAMFVSGELGELEFSLKALLEYFGWFYALAQIAYQQVKSR